jgi:type II restriction enzyme
MRPDGGILHFVSKDQKTSYPILITEVKNQGTNDIRATEGTPKQAKGNAIERLGKNVIGFRTALLHEAIFPFVCFGDGCDFAPDSSCYKCEPTTCVKNTYPSLPYNLAGQGLRAKVQRQND